MPIPTWEGLTEPAPTDEEELPLMLWLKTSLKITLEYLKLAVFTLAILSAMMSIRVWWLRIPEIPELKDLNIFILLFFGRFYRSTAASLLYGPAVFDL